MLVMWHITLGLQRFSAWLSVEGMVVSRLESREGLLFRIGSHLSGLVCHRQSTFWGYFVRVSQHEIIHIIVIINIIRSYLGRISLAQNPSDDRMKRVRRGGQNVHTQVRQFITNFVIIVANIIVTIKERAERRLPPEFMRPWPICVACNFCEKKLMRCHTRHIHITPTHCNIPNYTAEGGLVLSIIDTILSTKRMCHCCQKNLLCKCLKTTECVAWKHICFRPS